MGQTKNRPDLSGRCGADRRIRRSGRASRPAGSTDYDKFDETDPVVCVSLNLAHRSPAATPCARSDARGQVTSGLVTFRHDSGPLR